MDQTLLQPGRTLWIRAGPGWCNHRTRTAPRSYPSSLNFTATITEEREVDDGEQVQERYTIMATCGDRTRNVDMAREDFEGDGALGRIVAALGARARVNPRAQAAGGA